MAPPASSIVGGVFGLFGSEQLLGTYWCVCRPACVNMDLCLYFAPLILTANADAVIRTLLTSTYVQAAIAACVPVIGLAPADFCPA